METKIKQDKRTKKTKKAIRTAMAELLQEKISSDISVTLLSERAGINRKTFYRHYEKVEDVITDIEKECIRIFLSALETTGAEKGSAWILRDLFRSLNRTVEEETQMYEALFQSNEGIRLLHQIRKRITEVLLARIPAKEQSFALELSIHYAIAGLMAIYEECMKNKEDISRERMMQLCASLCKYSMHGISEFSRMQKQQP